MIWNYIESHKEITEVVLSGGDPLTVSNRVLKEIFDSIEVISHIKTVRIHSRIPAVSPQRIDLNFMRMLTEYGQSNFNIVMVHHINHPNEIGYDNGNLFRNIKSLGVLQLNQSVLLKGVNDKTEILCQLSEDLFDIGIQPYYLHMFDKVQGAAHFEVDESSAKNLLIEMMATLPGFLVPKLVREIAGEANKTPINLA